jgi:hypothetical protein
MHIPGLSRPMSYPMIALLMIAGSAIPSRAQGHDDHGGKPATAQPLTPPQNDLVKIVRDATARFRNVTDPSQVGDPYTLLFGCVSGGDFGAMGLHFVRGDILHDGDVKDDEPEIVLFEPTREGASG